MSASNSDLDKPYEASQKKLDDARNKGEIARSSEANSALVMVGMLFWLSILIPYGLDQSLWNIARMWSPDDQSQINLLPAWFGFFSIIVSLGILPLLIIVFVTVQRGWTFNFDKLQPKISRISIIKNAKQKFGSNGVFEFSKSLIKLITFSLIFAVFVSMVAEEVITAALLDIKISSILGWKLFQGLFALCTMLFVLIGFIDFIWQKRRHLEQNKMSHQELKEEVKEDQGDPYFRQSRKQQAQSIAMNTMLTDARDADVIIANPTHYSVALKWVRLPGSAPICVAKGVDHIALLIRTIASDANIPIHEDVPTARALYASVDVGDEIPPQHYAAVATAIRFAENARGMR